MYYKSPSDLFHPLGIIYLFEAFVDNQENMERMENVFVVRSDAKRFVFSADSQDDKLSWIRSIDLYVINDIHISIKTIVS